MDKITTINGVLMATQNDFTEHVENANIHIMEEERTAWNAKADAHELGSKLDTDVFTAHESNAVKHVSTEEREKWNRAPETDADKYINACRIQETCKSAMSLSVCIYNLGVYNFIILDIIHFKLLCVSKMLKNLSVFVCYCYSHFIISPSTYTYTNLLSLIFIIT